MEIKTCEQYVLEELRSAHQEIELLKKVISDQGNAINDQANTIAEYSKIKETAKKVADILKIVIDWNQFSNSPCIKVDGIFSFSKAYNESDYELVTEFFGLEESVDDRTEESATTD